MVSSRFTRENMLGCRKPLEDQNIMQEGMVRSKIYSVSTISLIFLLAVLAIVVIFIVPELPKGDLQSSFPESLTEEERLIVDTLMAYDGPNGEGLSIMYAISNQISEYFPNEKIYDHKQTKVSISVSKLENENFQVAFDFESYKVDLNYDWDVDMQNGNVEGNDEESKYIINLVDFYN